MNARARETCAQDRFIVSSPSCNFGHLVTGGGFFVTDAPQPSVIVDVSEASINTWNIEAINTDTVDHFIDVSGTNV